jgi:two-component system, OmpR family, sensor histidine kinase MprB
MSLRLRLTVLVSLAVAVAIVGASFVVYYTDRGELIGQVDSELSESRPLVIKPKGQSVSDQRPDVSRRGPVGSNRLVPIPYGSRLVILRGSLAAVHVVVNAPRPGSVVPKAAVFTTATSASGLRSRVLTYTAQGRVVRISRSLLEVDRNLEHLRWLLVLISLGGVGVAALLGALVARTAVAPLRRLTETTERIIDTGDLSERIGHRGRDEISRLSARLDELLATLEASLGTQRQLVADASHELRTPIATLRANFELLADPGMLEPHERAELAADVRDELESITRLVGELVELARGEELDVVSSEFRLDEVVRVVVDRAARRAPDLVFRTQLEPSVVRGVPERVERAVSNLLDNARKWSPARETVDVAVHDGLVEVRDRGPGIAAEDLPLVFNRFYRSAKARAMPGAGLGLAIVKQIADAHGGSVTIDRAPDGGAILRLRLSSTR